jgi:hypothetical protein
MPLPERGVAATPLAVAACQVKAVPLKLSVTPLPLTSPAEWSNEKVYKASPMNATWLEPSGRDTVLSLSDTPDGPLGFSPLATVRGVQIATQPLLWQRILPAAFSWSDVYSVRPRASTSTFPVAEVSRTATVVLLLGWSDRLPLLLVQAATSASVPSKAATGQPNVLVIAELPCAVGYRLWSGMISRASCRPSDVTTSTSLSCVSGISVLPGTSAVPL